MFRFIAPRFIFKVEKWKWNKEYRLYVSNMGHFKDEHKQPKPIKMGSTGYIYVKTRNGYITAHRLVMKTWKPTEDMDNLTVDHLDHNKRNNSVDNLEWVTQAINRARARKDFLVIKEDEQKPVIQEEPKKNSKMRYSRTNFTPDDVEWFVVNNEKFPSMQEAHSYCILLIQQLQAKYTKGPTINANDITYDAVVKRYLTLINRANTKEVNVIDGKSGSKCFKYLNMKIIIKKQEDEE